jgi:triacylglycerol lipase
MSERNPIVFIHGNGDSADGWQIQMERFKANGYSENELFAITMTPPQNESHQHYADQVKPFIEDVIQKTGRSKINIVAHSLGCTVSRHYIKHMGGDKIVDRVVLICGGNHGIPAADLTMNQPEVFKQSPEVNTMGASFLNDLNTGNPDGLETFGPTEYMTISGPDDEFYLFYESSPQLKGADNRIIRGYGHFGLRSCEESFQLMMAFFAGNADRVSTGKDAMSDAPSDPSGEWHIAGGPNNGMEICLNTDSTYVATESGQISKGTYTTEPQKLIHRISLNQTEGPGNTGKREGIYRLNVNNTFLRLALSDLNVSKPPQLIAFAPTYERRLETNPIINELVGPWQLKNPGFLIAAGWTNATLTIQNNAQFVFEGDNTMSPTGKVRIAGKVTISLKPSPHHISFEISETDGNVPFFVLGEVLPGLFHLQDKTLYIQWGSATFGIPRPACMDAPIMLMQE